MKRSGLFRRKWIQGIQECPVFRFRFGRSQNVRHFLDSVRRKERHAEDADDTFTRHRTVRILLLKWDLFDDVREWIQITQEGTVLASRGATGVGRQSVHRSFFRIFRFEHNADHFDIDSIFSSQVGFDPLREALLESLFASGADLVILPVQDVFGWRDRINQPATVGAANWTWRFPWPVDRIAAEPQAVAVTEELLEWTRRHGRASG